MTKRPPLPLIITAVAYLGFEVWTLYTEHTVTVATRLALSLILFYFVLRGSRAAGLVLAVLCIATALVCVWGITVAPQLLGLFAVSGILALCLAAYLFFSPTVRAFQQREPPVQSS